MKKIRKQIQAFTVISTLCIVLMGCKADQDTTPSKLLEDYPDYQSSSLQDFNASIKSKIEQDIDFLSTFGDLMNSPLMDEDFSFVYETLNYSISEIISLEMGDPISYSNSLRKNDDEYTDENGDVFYNYMFTAFYSVDYVINDETNITVGERDNLLRAYQAAFQSKIDDMNKEQFIQGNIADELEKMAQDLALQLSTDSFIFKNATIHSIEVHDNGQEILY